MEPGVHRVAVWQESCASCQFVPQKAVLKVVGGIVTDTLGEAVVLSEDVALQTLGKGKQV